LPTEPQLLNHPLRRVTRTRGVSFESLRTQTGPPQRHPTQQRPAPLTPFPRSRVISGGLRPSRGGFRTRTLAALLPSLVLRRTALRPALGAERFCSSASLTPFHSEPSALGDSRNYSTTPPLHIFSPSVHLYNCGIFPLDQSHYYSSHRLRPCESPLRRGTVTAFGSIPSTGRGSSITILTAPIPRGFHRADEKLTNPPSTPISIPTPHPVVLHTTVFGGHPDRSLPSDCEIYLNAPLPPSFELSPGLHHLHSTHTAT
jgi:hypothetical protein